MKQKENLNVKTLGFDNLRKNLFYSVVGKTKDIFH